MGTVVITNAVRNYPRSRPPNQGQIGSVLIGPDVPQCRADAVEEHVPVTFGEHLEAA